MTNPLIIKDWDQGIADSPHKGHALLRNVDIESFPGAIKTVKKPGTYFHKINTVTFTADAGTDIYTASGTIEANGAGFNGAAVYFTTTGTLPTGLSLNIVYFLLYASSSTFKVAVSYKNSAGSAYPTPIDITGAGSGTHTMIQLPIGTINWIIEDTRTDNVWMLSSNGRVWFSLGSNIAYLLHNSAIESVTGGITNATGNGLVLSPFSSTSSTYLFVFRNALIDVIDIFGVITIETPVWSNGWKSMNTTAGSSNSHHAIQGQDNIIYFTDDRYTGSIKENSGSIFDPATAGTYTYNNQALDMPIREICQCLEEHGINLLVGGNTYNQIYPWDRTSDSYNLPLSVPEFGIKRMKNIGGIVYILAGTWGNIYQTQGSYVRHVKKLPTYLTNNAGSIQLNPIIWGGIAASNNTLLFGVSTVTSGNSGLWRMYLDGRIVIDNIPSTGSTNVIGLMAKNDFYRMGYEGGADNFNSMQYGINLYNSYETVLQSGLFQVATKIEKATYSRLELVIAKPATSGNARVSYRQDLSSSFITLDAFSADSATTTFTSEGIGLIDIDKIQVQIEMNDGSSGYIDFEFIEVRLMP